MISDRNYQILNDKQKKILKIRTASSDIAFDLVKLARTLDGVVALCDIPIGQEELIEKSARMVLLY